jgi:putative transcriptional regulator
MTNDKTTDREEARFAAEMAENLADLRSLGLMDEATYKRTLRDLTAEEGEPVIMPLSGPEIRALRERANVSQAFLAKYLNLTPAHLSKLERGAVHPTGALLAMLNVIRRRGLEAIL